METTDHRNENASDDVWETLNDKVRSEKMREVTRVEEIGQFVR